MKVIGRMSSFYILDESGGYIARLSDETLARQFAISDKMLAIINVLGEADKHRAAGTVGLEYIHLVAKAVDMAREIIERMEQ